MLSVPIVLLDIRVATQLIMLMDSSETTKVVVVASTNRIDALDPALIRSGRFDSEIEVTTSSEEERLQIFKVLYIPPPDVEARYEILRVLTRKMKLSNDVDLKQIAQETERFTGAELQGLCREAGIAALRENITATAIHSRHFQTVKKSLIPALTSQEIDSYISYILKKPTRKPPHQLAASSSKHYTKN